MLHLFQNVLEYLRQSLCSYIAGRYFESAQRKATLKWTVVSLAGKGLINMIHQVL